MRLKYSTLALFSVLLAFGCTEESRKPQTVASQNTGNHQTDKPDKPQTPPGDSQPLPGNPQTPVEDQPTQTESIMRAKIDETEVTVQWEDNDAVKQLKALALQSAVSVNMSRYGGFEQVGALGQPLPRSDTQMTTAPGDIVLYSGDRIVIFYGSNSWSYTRLGKITDTSGAELKALLDKDSVILNLSADADVPAGK